MPGAPGKLPEPPSPDLFSCPVPGFIFPEMKKARHVIIVVVIAAILSTCFTYIPFLKKISPGLAISICAIIAAVIGAMFFPIKEKAEINESPAEEGGAV